MLTTLPTEIRLQIYTHLLHAPHIFILTIDSGRDHVHYPLHPLHPSILRVSHLIFSEALPVLYSENTFHFLSNLAVRRYFLAKRCMSLLRDVRLGPMQIGAYMACSEMTRSVRHLKVVCPKLRSLGLQFWIAQYTNKELVGVMKELVRAVGQGCADMDIERVVVGCNNDVSEMELAILDLKGLQQGTVKRELVIDWLKHALAVMGRVGQLKLGTMENTFTRGVLQRVEKRVLVDRRLVEEWPRRLPPPTRWLTGCYAR
ncbi:MAG: hypothetical protein M1835_001750 [Candelina submexicana]|nr:MAG: hypothetical protein M1835_001750 [Candelina submexicana]